MENEGIGAQTLSTVDEKFTIVPGEASSLSILTHPSNSLKLPRALYRTLRNEYVVKKTPACYDRFGLVLGLVYVPDYVSFDVLHICKYPQ